MAEPLKNMYNAAFFDDFAKALTKILKGFDKDQLLDLVYNKEWENLELKQRMRHLSGVLQKLLDPNFKKATTQVLQLTEYLKANHPDQAFQYIFLPDFIEQYGLDDYATSMQAFEHITSMSSCEFAVRPFIAKYPEPAMQQMLAWSKHENHHVRRFSSEGCRPRLPWAMALNDLKKDPSPILPILDNLKEDPSEYVRKSVANNINDISKDHPDITISLVRDWIGKNPNTDWILKHGSRTLLKQGNPEVMELFGLGSIENISIQNFKILSPTVKIGDSLNFEFDISNNNDAERTLRLEYAIYYLRSNGSHSKKVFKISEKEYSWSFHTP